MITSKYADKPVLCIIASYTDVKKASVKDMSDVEFAENLIIFMIPELQAISCT